MGKFGEWCGIMGNNLVIFKLREIRWIIQSYPLDLMMEEFIDNPLLSVGYKYIRFEIVIYYSEKALIG